MAIVIKGFGILNEFESTIPDGLAPVGELSTRATTFSTDKTTHTDPDLDGGRFINFKTVNDTDLPIELPAAAEAYILNVIENISKFDMGYSADVQFNTIYPGLNGVVVGDSVLYMNRLIPTFVSFMVDIDSVSYSIKIWFSNEAFESEYDEFEIRVVPTYLPSLFQSSPAEVQAAVAAVNGDPAGLFNKILETADGDAYTSIKNIRLKWVYPLDSTYTQQIDWTIMCFGPRAETYPERLEAVRSYLLSSGVALDTWITIFPDLVSVDTFIVIPKWLNTSVATTGLAPALYNPMMTLSSFANDISALLPSYSGDAAYIESAVISYKSIGFLIQGSGANGDGSELFSSKFDDYTAINVNDANINRISAETKNVIQLIERLIRVAETLQPDTQIAVDLTRESIDGRVYIVGTVDTVTIKVLSRVDYIATISAL